MQYKLKMDREQVVERVSRWCAMRAVYVKMSNSRRKTRGAAIREFLYLVLGEAIKAGATTLNIPGHSRLHHARRIRRVDRGHHQEHARHRKLYRLGALSRRPGTGDGKHARGYPGRRASSRGHRQRHRRARGQHLARRSGHGAEHAPPVFNLVTGIDTTQIMRASSLVSNYTGIVVQPNKAIVGANAFAHEAGIHQDGMLKHQQTYEIMRPETVGVTQSRLVMGKHSGRHALQVTTLRAGVCLE